MSSKETEMLRRTEKLPKRDEVRERVQSALQASMDRDSLLAAFGHKNLELYVRGKTLGVIDHATGKKHRLKTLDLELADRVELRMSKIENERETETETQEKMRAGEKEKEGQVERNVAEAELKREPEPYSQEEEKMNQGREDGLEKPSEERQEFIDKGHIEPDPERDLMSHEDWQAQDTFSNKTQQSWRRTMDDFRGRTSEMKEKARSQGKSKGRQR